MLGSIASMCSAMRGTVGDIMESEDGGAIMGEILEECRKVAAAEGYPPSDKVVGAVKASLTQKGGKSVASILGDIEKGGAVEAKSDRRRHAGARPQARHRGAQPALRLRASADL